MLARRRSPLLALLGLALAAPAAAQAPDPLAGFDAYVAQAVKDWGATGLSVAVVKDGKTVFLRGYGVRELGKPDPVGPSTLFAIGSTTKAMTAAALGVLVDEGKVEWDDPVIRHLPWFQLRDPVVTREVTVRDLLTHRAGLGNADFLWTARTDLDTRGILELMRELEPVYSLRDDFIYQNLMYAAAGEVVAAASGMPWTEFVRTRLIRPIGMRRTVMTLAETIGVPDVAAPHDVVDGEVRVVENVSVDPVAAAGSVWSSAEEMAMWLNFLLRDCVTESGARLLEKGTCDELFRPQTVLREPQYPTAALTDPNWFTYGLAWFQQDYEGRKVDYHTGSINGMVAIAGLIRDENLGVFVLGNRDHTEVRHALMWRVFDLFDADPPRDWNTEVRALYAGIAARGDSARAAAEARRVTGTSPSLALAGYTGRYTDLLRGTAQVSVRDGSLVVDYNGRTGRLEHWNYDTFRAHWEGVERSTSMVRFILGADGVPESLMLGGATLRRERPARAGRGGE